ncbi:MAG: glycoside hydrolase TIM-barrel-like domain-containing protein, partial [Beijerinckiaceae bacterium]|nr:glycoside hydrolase TIM-barrel-like domain-containing protein [Beijerinckiaceae bacterium]
GEGYDWYYANAEDRKYQNRTAITDGASNKPWVFRQKDISNWWSNAHHERMNGTELPAPTGWVPQSKPIWLTEIGCPAVDKGSNAPNVFPDDKSSENAIPYFSSGFRDDLIQQRMLQAILEHFAPSSAEFQDSDNPLSTIYGGRMVRADRSHIWAWDARPFPAFPAFSDIWSDSSAWETGHWINGRLESAALDDIIRDIIYGVPGLEGIDIETRVSAMADGYIVERPMAPRSAIEPLSMFYGFDAIISSGRMLFQDRSGSVAKKLEVKDLVVEEGGKSFQLVRGQESELSQSISVTFHSARQDYRSITTGSRRLEGFSGRQAHFDIPVVADEAEARRRTDTYLQELWTGRETGHLVLPASMIAIEVGDTLSMEIDGAPRLIQLTRLEDAGSSAASVRAVDPATFKHNVFPAKTSPLPMPVVAGPPDIKVLDLAIAKSDSPPLQYVAAFADPWTGPLAIWRKAGEASYLYSGLINQRARIGVTLQEFGPGPVARFDMRNEILLRLPYGSLESQDTSAALSGRLAIAVEGIDGLWEIINFAQADLVGNQQYRLRKLVRGLGGAEHLAQRVTPAGSSVVVLDDAILPLAESIADVDVPTIYRIGPARRPYNDASYTQISTAASTLALRPYAPVNVRARRTNAGIEIIFVRRGRVNSDVWTGSDIPLAEVSEKYEIEILASGVPVRNLATTVPMVVYAAAAELADFGAQQNMIEIAVYQISHVAGRGFPLNANIPVT